MKTIKMIFILSLFLISFINAQSKLANIWISNGEFSRSYHINEWSENAKVLDGKVYINDKTVIYFINGEIKPTVLINNVPNSSPAYIQKILPKLSLMGLSNATGEVGEDWSKPMLSISPNGGDFNDTIKVTINLIAPNEFEGVVIYTIDNNQPIETPISTKNNSINFYLYKKGTHTITYQLKDNNNIQTATFNIDNNQNDIKKDTDGDGIPDSIEIELGLDPLDGTIQDSDGDGWNDFDELVREGNTQDSDGDGWSDWDEINLRHTDKDNNRSKPTAYSLYGVEYNITSKAYDNNIIKKSLYRVSFVDVSSVILYDSLKLLDINLSSEYYNIAISPTIHSDLNKSLILGDIPAIRIPADKAIIERVENQNSNDINNSWVAKSFINSTKPLSLKDYYIEFNKTTLPNNFEASDFIKGFVEYLKKGLIVQKDIRVDNNSSIKIALLESAFSSREENNGTFILGNPTFLDNSHAYTNILKALSLEDNRDINSLYLDLVSILNKNLEENLLKVFSSTDELYSTEMRLAKFMLEKLSSQDRYNIALMTIVSFSKAKNFSTVWILDSDSDNDNLINKDEVLPILTYSNPLKADSDNDGIKDGQDPCINDSNNICMNDDNTQLDSDKDGIIDTVDNCPYIKNPNQLDSNNDGIGDECSLGEFVIVNPRTTLHLLQGDNFTFEAKYIKETRTVPQWYINGQPIANSATLRYEHFFTESGTFEICILKDSCIDVVVEKREIASDKLNIYATSPIEEGDSNHTMLVELELAEPLSYAVEYDYSTDNKSAISSKDYLAINGTVIFKPKETRKFIPITIIGDNEHENNEYFTFIAKNKNNSKEINITIIDDDKEIIIPDPTTNISILDNHGVELYNKTVIEEDIDSNITFRVALDKPITKEGSIHYELLPIPTSSTSYNSMIKTPIEGDLSFQTGEQVKEFNVTIIGDLINEYDNNFTIRFSNPININLGNNQDIEDVTINIVDNDPMPTVSFKYKEYKVLEGDHETIELELSNISYKNIEVNLTLDSNSTAEDSEDIDADDFNLSSYNILFPFSTPNNENRIATLDINISKNPDDSDEELAIFNINKTKNAYISQDKNSTIFTIYENNTQTPISLISTHAFMPFDGKDGHGIELWDSNGSIDGTSIFSDIVIGIDSSYPKNITRVGDRLIYFIANDSNYNSILCVTNGIDNNVTIVHNFEGGLMPSSLIAVEDKLYFAVINMNEYTTEIWKSEGNESSTRSIGATLNEIHEGNDHMFAKLGTSLYFSASIDSSSENDMELYKLDTLTDTISLIKDIKEGENGSFPSHFIPYGNILYFVANGSEIWKTDGTEIGTEQIIADRDMGIDEMTISNNILYYSMNNYPDAKLEGLNLLNGTPYNIREYNEGGNISALGGVNNYLLYVYAKGHSYSLVKVEEDIATDIESPISYPYPTKVFNGLYFYAVNGALYITNGDSPSLLLRKELSDREAITFMEDSIDNKLFFTVEDYNTNSSHLWVTDGSVEGTAQLK